MSPNAYQRAGALEGTLEAFRALARTESHRLSLLAFLSGMVSNGSMPKQRRSFSEQLRIAILEADVTRYRIAQETDVAESALCRFMKEEVGLSLDSIDRIWGYLELDITTSKRKPRKRKGKR